MQITSYHLLTMPSAQCHVEFFRTDAGTLKEVRLVSYTTTILTAVYDAHDVKLFVNHYVGCSKTTARHVSRFTVELAGTDLCHELKNVPIDGMYVVKDTAVCLFDMARQYAEQGKRWH